MLGRDQLPTFRVRVATTAALPAHTRVDDVLTASANGALGPLDGVTLVTGDSALAKDEGGGTHLENGAYVLRQGDAGNPWALTRVAAMSSTGGAKSGTMVEVVDGSVNGRHLFVLTTDDPITINATALRFRPVFGVGLTEAGQDATIVGLRDRAGNLIFPRIGGSEPESGLTHQRFDFEYAATQVWQVEVGDVGFVDQTAGFNDAAAANFTPFRAAEQVGDYCAIGSAAPFTRVVFNSTGGTQGVGGVVVWEFWNGSAWAALTNVVDATAGFTAPLGGNQVVSFDFPNTWVARTLNGSGSLFYVRARVTQAYSTNSVLTQGTVTVPDQTLFVGINPTRAGADANKPQLGIVFEVRFNNNAEWYGVVVHPDGTQQRPVGFVASYLTKTVLTSLIGEVIFLSEAGADNVRISRDGGIFSKSGASKGFFAVGNNRGIFYADNTSGANQLFLETTNDREIRLALASSWLRVQALKPWLFNDTIAVGQNTDPDPSAVAEFESTSKGVLLPRLTTSQRDAISTPSAGLQLHNSSTFLPGWHDGFGWRQTQALFESPLDVQGLVNWMRADLGVTLDGSSKVQDWANRSRVGGSFAQSDSAKRPSFVASQASLGGKPTVSMAATSNHLIESAALIGVLPTCTIVWVNMSRTPGAGGLQELLLVGSGAQVYPSNGAGNTGFYDGTAHRVDGAGVSGANYGVLVLDSANLRGRFRRNGVPLGSWLTYDGTFGAAAAWQMGFDGEGAGWEVAEVMMFNRVLSGHEIADIEHYIQVRYAL